ncbi:hypothetical protein [Embleya sp. NBC_00896]|uniref:hypothetical protein n=1 Tax=Embleya sp. NBC_00896 TaxID=2975961 RepID=UPI003868D182|nr:hypothetical protein OG928_29205 [Embleya sp. NBC_00896]
MTRLVFVHGRAQEGKDPDALCRLWVDALTEGLGVPTAPPAVAAAAMPFYGDTLAEWVTREPPALVAYGGGDGQSREISAFAQELVLEMATAYDLTDQAVAAELPAGALKAYGVKNWAWVQAVLAALDRKVSFAGRGVLRFVADVEAYLQAPYVGEDIRQIVSEPLRQAATDHEPVVVVAHSLGSVVAYEILRDLVPTLDVPLFVTVGSALGFATIQRHLRPPPLARPAGVTHWLNVYDPRDPVSLRRPGAKIAGFPGVDDHLEVPNPHNDAHGVAGYLSHPGVAARIGHEVDR